MKTNTEIGCVPAHRATADALRFLAADAVELAKSGHPGAPMGMAEMAEVVWRVHLRHNPANPGWINRDRFVLSNGHASMLLYSLLHLSGYDLSIDDLMRFRQLHSKTPGHPEVGVTPGVETTTGPLGQGLANAVGMALAEQQLALQFNRQDAEIIDHHTYVFLGDGCLMEGISHEASALAGTLGLSKLICLYDDNGISIDGEVSGWFTDDTVKRFQAYGWNVIGEVDGHDVEKIDAAIREAKSQSERPTLICCKTVIGQGAPTKAGSHDVHGSPLGVNELQTMREKKQWNTAPFEVPQAVRNAWDAREAGLLLENEWQLKFAKYASRYPDLAAELLRRSQGLLPSGFAEKFKEFLHTSAELKDNVATRKASQIVLEFLVPTLPELFGGSADLTSSNLTKVRASVSRNHNASGNYLSYGVREFGMAAMMNGMALYGAYIPYGGTFLTFSDYSRNAIRMAALMRQRVIHVLSHDSIGVGEDGPTHQPVEHVSSLRLIPNNRVWRPCDGLETAIAWQSAITRNDGPSCLILSRQNLPAYERDTQQIADCARGGYVLKRVATPSLTLIATGSEVAIAAQAQVQLAAIGIATNLVSIPCVELFFQQDQAYRDSVLPADVPRLSIEAGVTWFWRAIVGERGVAMGIDQFGESAPANQLYGHFNLTAQAVVEKAKAIL